MGIVALYNMSRSSVISLLVVAVGVDLSLVDRMPCRAMSRCPTDVSQVLGGFLRIIVAVRLGAVLT